jgi:ParB-like nuclease domain
VIKVLGVEEIEIDCLVPYPQNARRGNVGVIMDSIREFGQYGPLVCRAREHKPPMVLAGNHTLKALAGLGHQTARVELIECSDDEAKRIVIADNRTGDLATWDEVALAAQLESFGDDFAGTGFTLVDAEKLLFGSAGRDEREVPEDEPAWQILIDCTDEEHQAELLTRFAEEGLACRPLIRS